MNLRKRVIRFQLQFSSHHAVFYTWLVVTVYLIVIDRKFMSPFFNILATLLIIMLKEQRSLNETLFFHIRSRMRLLSSDYYYFWSLMHGLVHCNLLEHERLWFHWFFMLLIIAIPLWRALFVPTGVAFTISVYFYGILRQGGGFLLISVYLVL